MDRGNAKLNRCWVPGDRVDMKYQEGVMTWDNKRLSGCGVLQRCMYVGYWEMVWTWQREGVLDVGYKVME